MFVGSADTADVAIEGEMSESLPDQAVETSQRRGRSQAVGPRAVRLSFGLLDSPLLLDCTCLVAASVAVALLLPDFNASYVPWQILFGVLVIGQLSTRGVYVRRLRLELLEDSRIIVPATAVAAMTALVLESILSDSAHTNEIASQWGFATVYLIAGRAGSRLASLRSGSKREPGVPTLIIGAGKVGHLIATRLIAQPSIGFTPIGFLDKEPLHENPLGLPVLGASWDLEHVVGAHAVKNVIITFSTAPTSVVLDIVRRCEQLGVTVSSVPRLYESINGRLTLDYFGGIPLLTRNPVHPRGWQFRCKYAADRVLATLLVFLFLPMFVTIAIAVWIAHGSPVFFRQTRIGRDGKPFEMLKFRSMRGFEQTELGLPAFRVVVGPGGIEGDDRRTSLGRLLRLASLDELPQLLNVMRGDMSLVGPRPERPGFVERFENEIYRYGDRHRVKGGMTGWAQIHGLRGKTSLSDRVEWDNYYIESWSPWLDVKTLLLTLAALVRGYRTLE